jgi:hypothetical protein
VTRHENADDAVEQGAQGPEGSLLLDEQPCFALYAAPGR